MDFRIYYDLPDLGAENRVVSFGGKDFDISVSSNVDGLWTAHHGQGVVCVVIRDRSRENSSFVLSGVAPIRGKCETCGRWNGNEFYMKADDEEDPHTNQRFTEFLDKLALTEQQAADQGFLKYGRQVDQDKWAAIQTAASDDPDFPRTSPKRRASDFA